MKRSKTTQGRQQAYLADALRLVEGMKPGTVNHVEVKHEHDCNLLNGRGACNCKPDVRVVVPS